MPLDLDLTAACAVCGKPGSTRELTPLAVMRPGLAELIRATHPGLPMQAGVCRDDLDSFRRRYLEKLLAADKGQVRALEREVIDAMAGHEMLATDADTEADQALTAGERLADRVAEFGGSWTFIISFGVILLVWMSLNSLLLARGAFDPYPYILLNLVLSCIAALQAPIIMMSQRRQEARDRRRSENDYQVNLKAELEIRHLHEKLDSLLHRQWEHLLEFQQLQMDMMGEANRLRRERD